MEDAFLLKYDGLSASQGELDAYDAADALRGFADFSRRISEGVYGQKVGVRTSVRDIRRGSVVIELINHILSPDGLGLFVTASEHLPTILKLIGECVKLFKHLQGQKPAGVKRAENGSVYVENNSGTIINVNNLTLNFVLDNKIGQATENFVKRPLSRSANKVSILNNGEEIAKICQNEARYSVPLDGSDILTDHTSEVYLTIGTTVFEGKSMWKFHDGRNTFSAKIEDQTFLRRVSSGEERFGKGDTLLVRLRAQQKRDKGALRAEFAVEEVINHLPAQPPQGILL